MPKTKKQIKPRKKKPKASLKKIFVLAALVIACFIIGSKFRGLIVVATVNGKPIYSGQFIKRIFKSYGQRVLDEMVSEKLVIQEAASSQVVFSDEEVDKEIEKITEEMGGRDSFQKALEEEGINTEELQKRIKIQLTIEALLEKDLSITDKEIEAFIRQYETQMQATDEASRKEEAQEALKSQKMSEAYADFFPGLKEKAQISQFLKF